MEALSGPRKGRCDLLGVTDVGSGQTGPAVGADLGCGDATVADQRCFDTDHAIVGATVEQDLPPLVDAVRRLRQMLESQE